VTVLSLIWPLQVLVDIFEPVLVFFHGLIGSWGMAIVLLVVAVRLVVFPLTMKQMRSMQAMARLAPEMKELQQKYKDDRQRQQQELMKFYKDNNVNPAASCLPLLAQLPVFVALFYLLQAPLKLEICGQALAARGIGPGDERLGEITCNAVAPESADFLFINDLTASATGGVLVALIVMYIASQLVASLLSMTSADKTQRMIFLALPFVFVLFIINFPAGLIVYWITTNLWTAGQGLIIRRTIGPIAPPRPKGEEGEPQGLGALFKQIRESAGGPAEATNGADGSKREKAGASAGPARAPAKPAGPPPPSPRKKKKRSGRRR